MTLPEVALVDKRVADVCQYALDRRFNERSSHQAERDILDIIWEPIAQFPRWTCDNTNNKGHFMRNVIYLVGLVVIVLLIVQFAL